MKNRLKARPEEPEGEAAAGRAGGASLTRRAAALWAGEGRPTANQIAGPPLPVCSPNWASCKASLPVVITETRGAVYATRHCVCPDPSNLSHLTADLHTQGLCCAGNTFTSESVFYEAFAGRESPRDVSSTALGSCRTWPDGLTKGHFSPTNVCCGLLMFPHRAPGSPLPCGDERDSVSYSPVSKSPLTEALLCARGFANVILPHRSGVPGEE